MYIYIQSELSLYTVGFYLPNGKFNSESDHGSKYEASKRVHYLNGGQLETMDELEMNPEYIKLRKEADHLYKDLNDVIAERDYLIKLLKDNFDDKYIEHITNYSKLDKS